MLKWTSLRRIGGLMCAITIVVFLAWPRTGLALKFGVNADNWSNQIQYAAFEHALKQMGVEFIVWHLSPEEELVDERLMTIVNFCRQNNFAYLFNTELVNYVPDFWYFQQEDGTYRYDLDKATLTKLRDDPLFLGVVYDEAMHMQQLNGVVFEDRSIPPYFAETRDMAQEEAYNAVVNSIAEVVNYYGQFGKWLVFEMVFPDYAHAVARAGGVLAPKFLKETNNDLMFYMYASAARQYNHKELFINVDLWFLNNFPENGYYEPGVYHEPQDLYDALMGAYQLGGDYVYIEHTKALYDQSFNLTDYGLKVVEFQDDRHACEARQWDQFEPAYVVRRFPDGNWGQADYSYFIPYHPYGSWTEDPGQRARSEDYLEMLNVLTAGAIPQDANNWNAVAHPYYYGTEYQLTAGLPPIYFTDHNFQDLGQFTHSGLLDFSDNPLPSSTYEDAEDKNTQGWSIFDNDPKKASIRNVFDQIRQSRVIKLKGSGTDNGYVLRNKDGTPWHNSKQLKIQWSMRCSINFVVNIDIETTAGHRYISYTPGDSDDLGTGEYVHHGFGSSAVDGEWHTFTRDLQTDLEEAQPGVSILEVNGFVFRGSGKVDDIQLLSRWVK